MRRLLLSILIFSFFDFHAQRMDLIVTTREDSIVCKVTALSDSTISFKMMKRKAWIETYMPLRKVKIYKEDAALFQDYPYRSGTSIIDRDSSYDPVIGLNKIWITKIGDYYEEMNSGYLHAVTDSSILIRDRKGFNEEILFIDIRKISYKAIIQGKYLLAAVGAGVVLLTGNLANPNFDGWLFHLDDNIRTSYLNRLAVPVIIAPALIFLQPKRKRTLHFNTTGRLDSSTLSKLHRLLPNF